MPHIIVASTACGIAEPCRPSSTNPAASGGPVIETGTVIARIFDLLEGSGLEAFAAQVAWQLVNGACRQPQH
ncbi:hypothetical protein QLH51_05620 [Sphingomonas sp. 2R-10]|uniref:hypothetical protein n=1 Tax=Sphingomonas sp. 2R-10 TaxID=3045148 RepID=UPI000F76916F|nr:hypothetical protein [Sphingomonas sp. 2R-10]MDJ0276276.1 hypothetical protein [Sphingomonas sp. 2R-10]